MIRTSRERSHVPRGRNASPCACVSLVIRPHMTHDAALFDPPGAGQLPHSPPLLLPCVLPCLLPRTALFQNPTLPFFSSLCSPVSMTTSSVRRTPTTPRSVASPASPSSSSFQCSQENVEACSVSSSEDDWCLVEGESASSHHFVDLCCP